MNKKSLLLALITGTAPLIAQETPSQVLESLMQPLPSVAQNIQARAAAFPALRQIPSSACAFMSMADVQGNITKLLNNKLIMAASEGESAELIANIPPIESIAIAFEQGSEGNIMALSQLLNNANMQSGITQLLTKWQRSSKEEYQANFAELLIELEATQFQNVFNGVNKDDINLPEMRIITTMKPGSEALMTQMKQQFDMQIANMPIPMPIIKQDGYTVVSLPLAMGAAMLSQAPEGSLDAILKSQHYLAVKFEGNCISVIYSRDLKKISAASSIEQSMLSSSKLKITDASLAQGIVGCSFMNATLINMGMEQNTYAPYGAMLQSLFQTLAQKHVEQAPAFEAAKLATEQVRKQLSELKQSYINQIKAGDYTNVLWSNDKLNYTEVYNYKSTCNFKSGKLNAWNQIDQAETISYISMSPMSSMSSVKLNFDSKAFIKNAKTIAKGAKLTLDKKAENKLQDIVGKVKQNSDKIKTASQAICDIYKGTEGSITIYADNKGTSADICNSSCAAEVLKEGKAPRVAILSAVSDKVKLDAGIKALQGLCDKKCKLEDKYILSDKFISFGNSASLNQSLQSSLSQTPASKDFSGYVFYFNGKAIEPLIKDDEAKEALQLSPKIYAVAYPTNDKFIFRAILK